MRNLESLTLLNRIHENTQIDFSSLTRLRHIRTNNYVMNVVSIFAGMNNITSIESIYRNPNLELNLQNTTKEISSLTFYNKEEMNDHQRMLSSNLLTKFIGSLKHITILKNVDYNGFDQFFKDTRVLESITVHDSISMEFLKNAHDIKYFELEYDLISNYVDKNLIQFIQRQTNLQFVSITLLGYLKTSVFATYLNRIVDAILVLKTVKQLNLLVDVQVQSKIKFTQSFYKSLVKLGNLDLTLNGIPIKNVLRDIRKINDCFFRLWNKSFLINLRATEAPRVY